MPESVQTFEVLTKAVQFYENQIAMLKRDIEAKEQSLHKAYEEAGRTPNGYDFVGHCFHNGVLQLCYQQESGYDIREQKLVVDKDLENNLAGLQERLREENQHRQAIIDSKRKQYEEEQAKEQLRNLARQFPDVVKQLSNE